MRFPYRDGDETASGAVEVVAPDLPLDADTERAVSQASFVFDPEEKARRIFASGVGSDLKLGARYQGPREGGQLPCSARARA